MGSKQGCLAGFVVVECLGRLHTCRFTNKMKGQPFIPNRLLGSNCIHSLHLHRHRRHHHEMPLWKNTYAHQEMHQQVSQGFALIATRPVPAAMAQPADTPPRCRTLKVLVPVVVPESLIYVSTGYLSLQGKQGLST